MDLPVETTEAIARVRISPQKENGSHHINKTSEVNKRPGDDIQQRPNKRKIFIHGNYDRYYGYRNTNSSPAEDIRLHGISQVRALIEGKAMLDIGCNDGSLTLQIVKQCLPASTVGIDIDGDLIASARKQLACMKQTESQANNVLTALNGVKFRRTNYVYEDAQLLQYEKPSYDVVLYLSVTKWIHLNYGDAGLKLTFQRAFRQLHPGGILVLEAQPWASYKRKKKLSETILTHYKAIQLRPEAFKDYLLGDAVGFREFFELKLDTTHSSKGFQRQILVYRK